MMSLGDIAADLPWPVFACGDDKRPVVAHGFKAASRNPDVIRRQFSIPDATMIGMPTGNASGFIVIDIDIKNGLDGRTWLKGHSYNLPTTRTHHTQSGGLHLVFATPDGIVIRNSASKIAPGVDVRGEGGYVIIPPSPGYAIVDNVKVAEMPEWLIRACTYTKPQPAPPPSSANGHTGNYTKYIQAAIDGEIRAITSASEGTRNDTLNRAAFSLGTLVGAGQLSRSEAEMLLRNAGHAAGQNPLECAKTIKSGIDAGEQQPRNMPEQKVSHTQDTNTKSPDPNDFFATPLADIDLDNIPPRQWIYGRELVRGYVSVLASPGGTGKTAYVIGAGISIVSGDAILASDKSKIPLSCKVHKPGNVWIFNLEDPMDEMRRRIKAALMHHNVDKSAIERKLFIDSGRDKPLVIVKRTKSGLIVSPIVESLIEEIIGRKIDVLVVDPFVQSHEAEENRNEEMNFVMSLWGQVAHRGNCAVWLVHHFRKGGKTGDSESVRGAVAIHGAARSMFTIGSMSSEEADKLGVDDSAKWQYIRHDNTKSNLAPPAEVADWYRLVSVAIGNGDAEYPEGDLIQAIEAWAPPSPWDGLPWAMIERILTKIDQGPGDGEFYALGKQSKDRWAGHVVVADACKTESQAATILKAWKENELIEEGEYHSPKQKGGKTGCIRVNQIKFSEMRQGFSSRSFADE